MFWKWTQIRLFCMTAGCIFRLAVEICVIFKQIWALMYGISALDFQREGTRKKLYKSRLALVYIKFHSSTRNYELNLERTSNSSQLLKEVTLMFFIAYAFKGQAHVFAGQVKIVSHSSCRTSATLKYFCPVYNVLQNFFKFWLNYPLSIKALLFHY